MARKKDQDYYIGLVLIFMGFFILTNSLISYFTGSISPQFDLIQPVMDSTGFSKVTVSVYLFVVGLVIAIQGWGKAN